VLKTAPSDTVKALLQHGKRNEAMELYRRDGATRTDIDHLNKAEGIATERGISLDRALSEILNPRPKSAPLTPGRSVQPRDASTYRRRRQWAFRFLSAGAIVLGVGVTLIIVAVVVTVVINLSTPCGWPGNENYLCSGNGAGLLNLLFSFAALLIGLGGVGLLVAVVLGVLAYLGRRRQKRAQAQRSEQTVP